MHQNDLILFRESLSRVTAHEHFFDSFYNRFIGESEEIAGFFRQRDMAQLKKKLRETLMMVADTAEGRPGLPMYMEMLGRIHKRLRVERRHFDMWQTALLNTVADYDEQFDERVEQAWTQVIDFVIDLIFRTLQEAQRRAS